MQSCAGFLHFERLPRWLSRRSCFKFGELVLLVQLFVTFVASSWWFRDHYCRSIPRVHFRDPLGVFLKFESVLESTKIISNRLAPVMAFAL
jgi:hypothetical protein